MIIAVLIFGVPGFLRGSLVVDWALDAWVAFAMIAVVLIVVWLSRFLTAERVIIGIHASRGKKSRVGKAAPKGSQQ